MPRTWKDLLRGERKIYQHMLQQPWPEFIEMMKLGGMDAVSVDNEHGQFTCEQLLSMLRTAEACDLPAILRISEINEIEIKKALDMGWHAIMVPDIKTVDDAQRVLSYARYRPAGTRGACPFVRGNDYGMGGPDCYERANESLCIWLLLEGTEAIQNMEEIMKLDGFDIISVGPWDLSVALGVPGEVNHPKVLEAKENVVKLAEKYKKYTSVGISKPADVLKYKDNDTVKIINDYRIPMVEMMKVFRTTADEISHLLYET